MYRISCLCIVNMYDASTQGIDEHMINIHDDDDNDYYYYYYYMSLE